MAGVPELTFGALRTGGRSGVRRVAVVLRLLGRA